MIFRTEAVVLRTMEYGETSQIVTLFTREKGKITVIAKGARLLKSRFGATLQPMAYTQVVFYYKATRGLQTLTESSHVQPFHHISENLEKIAVGLRVVELVNALLQDEQEHLQVFNLLIQVLDRLDQADEHAVNLLPYFELRLSMVLGFAPHVDRESVETLPDDGGVLALDDGAVLTISDAANRPGRRASRTALRAYAVLARADLDTIMRMRLAPAVRREVYSLVEAYLQFHVEDAYPTRSDKVLARLFDAPGTPHFPASEG